MVISSRYKWFYSRDKKIYRKIFDKETILKRTVSNLSFESVVCKSYGGKMSCFDAYMKFAEQKNKQDQYASS